MKTPILVKKIWSDDNVSWSYSERKHLHPDWIAIADKQGYCVMDMRTVQIILP